MENNWKRKMTQGNKTSYTTWWLMLILWHMWNIQPGSTRAFGAMETSRYCECIDCFHISKCPARANFRFRRVIPVLIKYWYKFTENYFWRASYRALRLSCLLSGAFCRDFSHIFAFSVCNGPWIVPFGDAFWQTNILQSRICHRSIWNRRNCARMGATNEKKTEKNPEKTFILCKGLHLYMYNSRKQWELESTSLRSENLLVKISVICQYTLIQKCSIVL